MAEIFHFPEITEQKFHIYIAEDDMCCLHGHDFLEFTYVAEGTLEHYIQGERSVVCAGDYFIVDHGTVHSYRRISQQPLPWLCMGMAAVCRARMMFCTCTDAPSKSKGASKAYCMGMTLPPPFLAVHMASV